MFDRTFILTGSQQMIDSIKNKSESYITNYREHEGEVNIFVYLIEALDETLIIHFKKKNMF